MGEREHQSNWNSILNDASTIYLENPEKYITEFFPEKMGVKQGYSNPSIHPNPPVQALLSPNHPHKP